MLSRSLVIPALERVRGNISQDEFFAIFPHFQVTSGVATVLDNTDMEQESSKDASGNFLVVNDHHLERNNSIKNSQIYNVITDIHKNTNST
jgi:hypothetical protein